LASPEERVLAREGRGHHALAYGLEDLRLAEVGDQEAEGEGGGGGSRAHVRAGARAAFHEPGALEVAHGAADGDPRGPEPANEVRLAGEAVALFPAAVVDLALEGAVDLPMFRGFGPHGHLHGQMI